MQRSFSRTSLYCDESIDDLEDDENVGAAKTAAVPADIPCVDFRSPISYFLAAEVDHLPAAGYAERFSAGGPFDPNARLQAVDWIIKVNAFHGFHPKTAFIAVNYLDRFLSMQPLLKGYNTWRLLAVASLKLAAKIGETAAPPFRKLKILDSEFVFDIAKVNRMERLVLCALQWKIRPVSPFDFVDFFAAAAPVGGAVSDVILATRREVELVGQRFSAIAAVVIFLARGSTDGEKLTWIYEEVDKEEVERCQRLMDEYMTDTCRLLMGSKKARPVEGPAASVPERGTPPLCEEEIPIVSPLKRQKLG